MSQDQTNGAFTNFPAGGETDQWLSKLSAKANYERRRLSETRGPEAVNRLDEAVYSEISRLKEDEVALKLGKAMLEAIKWAEKNNGKN